MSRVILHMIRRFGHPFDTHSVSPKELERTLESVARNCHFMAKYHRYDADLNHPKH